MKINYFEKMETLVKKAKNAHEVFTDDTEELTRLKAAGRLGDADFTDKKRAAESEYSSTLSAVQSELQTLDRAFNQSLERFDTPEHIDFTNEDIPVFSLPVELSPAQVQRIYDRDPANPTLANLARTYAARHNFPAGSLKVFDPETVSAAWADLLKIAEGAIAQPVSYNSNLFALKSNTVYGDGKNIIETFAELESAR